MSGGFLKQIQQQRLTQKLSPQQIQLMKLLQVPTASLEDRISKEIEDNPALEIDESNEKEEDLFEKKEEEIEENDKDESSEADELDDYLQMDIEDYLQDDNDQSGAFYTPNNDGDEELSKPLISVEGTLHDYLEEQLNMLNLDDRQALIALQIIGSIDDDGYLRREAISIVDDLAFKLNLITTETEVERLITKIQDFDPAGIAASSLQECLLLQLMRNQKPDNKSWPLAVEILENNFNSFTKKHYGKIKQRLKTTDKEFKEAVDLILKLTPKPGSSYNEPGKNRNFIIPDFFIYNNNGDMELSLNSRNAPELHVSQGYREMLRGYSKRKRNSKKEKEALLFIKQKIDSAKWFIDAIKQRQHTLLITMNAIMEYQKNYFLTGNEMELRPMILKDIAKIINMDISTVSRVASSKYVQTEFGVFILKYFFSESIVTSNGEEVSTHEVKNTLQEIVNDEDKKHPYSDEQLMELLIKKGYPVARRTVAKYREQLEIPVARLRKEA